MYGRYCIVLYCNSKMLAATSYVYVWSIPHAWYTCIAIPTEYRYSNIAIRVHVYVHVYSSTREIIRVLDFATQWGRSLVCTDVVPIQTFTQKCGGAPPKPAPGKP